MRSRCAPLISILTVSVLLSICYPMSAYAVIPSLLGPLQGLLAILPQILLFIVAGFTALFSLKRWRLRFSRLTSASLKTKIIVALAALVLVGGSVAAIVVHGRWTTGSYGSVADQDLQDDAKVWPTFRGGLMRTGNADQEPGPEVGEEVWVFRDEDFRTGNFSSSPAVIGNRIYVGSAQADIFARGGVVYCLDTESGDMIWKYQTKREIFSSPAVVDGKVYIGEGLHQDTDAQLYCLDAATGLLLWSFQTSSQVESSPAVADGRIFFGAGAEGVYCLDAETGKQVWQRPDIYVGLSPAVHDGSVYVGTGYGETSIYCLDADTGAQKWKLPMDYPVWGSPSISSDRAYFGTGNGNLLRSDKNPHGKIVCVNIKTAEAVWDYEVDDSVLTAIALNGGSVYFGSRDGSLYCLDADSGKLRWKWETGMPVLSSPAVTDKYVYFGSDNGVVYCLDKTSGQLKWEFDTTITAPDGTKILSSPAVASNKVYVGSSSLYLFCLGEWE